LQIAHLGKNYILLKSRELLPLSKHDGNNQKEPFMTISIYGNETSFFRSVMGQTSEWRQGEFNEWMGKAFDSYNSGDYLLSVDNLLDALCYDSDPDSAVQLHNLLTHVNIDSELWEDASALVTHIQETEGKYGLTHLKLVAKFQHDFREKFFGDTDNRDPLVDKHRGDMQDVSMDMFSLQFGGHQHDEESNAGMPEDLFALLQSMMSSPEKAKDILLGAIKDSGVSQDTFNKTKSLLDTWDQKMDEIGASKRKLAESEESFDEEDIVGYAQAIEEVREALYAQNGDYTPAILDLWKKVLEKPEYSKQMEFLDLEDLHDCGKSSVDLFLQTKDEQILEGSIYLLRKVVTLAKAHGELEISYLHSLIFALNQKYEVSEDSMILKEITELGDELAQMGE